MFMNDKVRLLVDLRIELLSIVQYLSNKKVSSPLVGKFKNCYTDQIDKYFSAFQNHPIIKQYSGMAKKGFNYDAPVQLVLSLSKLPEFSLNTKLDSILIERAGGEDNIITFIRNLRDFALLSDFECFYNSNLSFYEEQKNKLKYEVLAENIAVVSEYFGEKQKNRVSIILSLMAKGNYGIRMHNIGEVDDMIVVLGVPDIISKIQYGPDLRLIWHEISHSYVNPVVFRSIDSLEAYKPLFNELGKAIKDNAYDDWRAVVCEYLVRAATTRIGYNRYGCEIGDKLMLSEKSQGFTNLDYFTEKLKLFEEKKRSFEDFNDFFSEIIRGLSCI